MKPIVAQRSGLHSNRRFVWIFLKHVENFMHSVFLGKAEYIHHCEFWLGISCRYRNIVLIHKHDFELLTIHIKPGLSFEH